MSIESPDELQLSSAIVLDEFQFSDRYSSSSSVDLFEDFAKKTFRRYEESNQSIDTFSLCLKTESYARFGFATEWTLNALKLGATNLTFRSHHSNIVIPLNEVFGNENVVRLCLESSTIKQLKVTECPRLKSLILSDLSMKSDTFFDIISCCPSLENLSLSNINYCERNNRGGYDEHMEYVSIPPPPTLILHNLRSLVVCDFDSHFLDDLSSKFPNLKHLTLGLTRYSGYKVIRNISSPSLETLNIMDQGSDSYYEDGDGRNRVTRVEFDVPSIRKFTFEVVCKNIPDVSFRSISGHQWEESHVSITNDDKRMRDTNRMISTRWFRQLSKFLTNLRGSKIHLCLHLYSYYSFDYDVGELDGLDVCEVEDLTLDIQHLSSLSCHALLDALFRICRPKIITQYAYDITAYKVYDLGDGSTDLFICKALQRAIQEKSSLLVSTQFMFGLRDLEGIDAQQLVGEVWMPQPLGSILADLKEEIHAQQQQRWNHLPPIPKTRFRLLLKWKS